MRTHSGISAVALFLLLTASYSDWFVPIARADGFTVEDINGPYGFSLSGSTPDQFGNPLPISAVGQFTAVNGVAENFTRTLKLGGLGLVDSLFAGRVSVDPDGRGLAAFCGDNIVRPPAPFVIYPRKSLEIFEFVLTGENNDVIFFIGTGFEPLPDVFDIENCPFPAEVSLATLGVGTIIGTVRRQDNGDDDD